MMAMQELESERNEVIASLDPLTMLQWAADVEYIALRLLAERNVDERAN